MLRAGLLPIVLVGLGCSGKPAAPAPPARSTVTQDALAEEAPIVSGDAGVSVHGFVALTSDDLPAAELTPLGALGHDVVRQLCSRVAETRVDPPAVAVALAEARSEYLEGEGRSFCLDWVAGPSLADYWVTYQTPLKYGVQRYPVVEHVVNGRRVAKVPIVHPHVDGVLLPDGRVIALVELRRGPSPFTETWGFDGPGGGGSADGTHFTTAAFGSGPSGERLPREPLGVTKASCPGAGFGSRLVDPIALEQVGGSVYVVGSDCSRAGALAVERWPPGSVHGEVHAVEPHLDVMGTGFHIAPGATGLWLAALELGPDPTEGAVGTYLGHLGADGWSRIELAGHAAIQSVSVDPAGSLWLTRDDALLRVSPRGEVEAIPSPRATTVTIAQRGEQPVVRVESPDGAYERPVTP